MTELKKPKVSTPAQQELDKVEKQFDAFDQEVKSMTMDRMNMAPKEESEPQTKIAQSDLTKVKDLYLKPNRTIFSKEKFNEKFRDDYNFKKEYVNFYAENKEIIGESITLWTKPFPGIPAEEWIIPVNKPLWGPRYLAEKLKKSCYHRMVMQQHVMTETNQIGQMYGALAVDTTIQRLDAHPVSSRRSVFMGASEFLSKKAA